MMLGRRVNITALGDKDMVSLLRLAGIRRYYEIEDKGSIEEDVRKALSEAMNEADVGIVAIQENYAKYVADVIAQLREEKSLIPVIIEIPSKYGTEYLDVTEYYKTFVRKFVGFDIEI